MSKLRARSLRLTCMTRTLRARLVTLFPWIVLTILAAASVSPAVPARAASPEPGVPGAASAPGDPPLLVLLTETGETRDSLPVFAVHPGGEAVAAGLSRGLPGTMLRVYRFEQNYLRKKDGIEVEPVYVLLSNRQGGFAREGFYLGDEAKPHAGYIDVKSSWPVTGEFGALDQIVPHELFHVMRRQLAGALEDGNANQVHALGVRTDRGVAFDEGCAEHFQALAFEHPDADPATRALAGDERRYEAVRDRLRRYRRELTARAAVATRLRLGFVAWYSNDEDVLRYFAVRDNAFAREPVIPERALRADDLYPAYLMESILTGSPGGAVKSVSRMVATEAVVASLFYRWAGHEGLRNSYRDEAFYEQFGASASEVQPLENVYLKLIDVLYVHKPIGVLDVIEGYRRSFPDEAPYLDELAADVFLGQPTEAPGEIWLANAALQTGTTLFDQFRGMPRTHTFDLNAASLADLAGVPGVGVSLARAIALGAPYTSIDDLRRVPGMSDKVVERFQELRAEMDALRAQASEQNIEDVVSIKSILVPFIRRALLALAIAFVAGAFLYRVVRGLDGGKKPSLLRAASNGLGAALVGLLAGWFSGAMGLASLGAVCVLFGVPAGLWRLRKTRRPAAAVLAVAPGLRRRCRRRY